MILEHTIDAARRVWTVYADGATYDDGSPISARDGAVLSPYHGNLDDLERVGDLPEGWPDTMPDPRPYRAPAPDMPALRQAALTRAMAYGSGITAPVKAPYTPDERETWPLQRAQADMVLAGGELPPDALLRELAAMRGVEIEPFALSVQHKAQKYEAIVVAGQRLRIAAQGLLSADLDTPEKLAAAVEALRAQTLTAAADLGLSA